MTDRLYPIDVHDLDTALTYADQAADDELAAALQRVETVRHAALADMLHRRIHGHPTWGGDCRNCQREATDILQGRHQPTLF